MEHSMKEGWKRVLAILMLPAICFVSPLLAAQAKPGEDTFKAKCASCHGADGAGKTAMGAALKIRDLRSDEVQKQSDADLNRVISKGKNKMPAFDGKLKKEQIEQLVNYVRELGKKQ